MRQDFYVEQVTGTGSDALVAFGFMRFVAQLLPDDDDWGLEVVDEGRYYRVSLQQSLSQIPDFGSPIRGRMVRGRLVEFGNLGGNDEDSQLPLLPGSEVVVSLKPPGRIPFLSWFEG